MSFKSVTLCLGFEQVTQEEAAESLVAETFAVELCVRMRAHLSVCLAATYFSLPTAAILGVVRSLVDEVNADRHARAETAERRIANAATIAGVTAEFHILQNSYSHLSEALLGYVRPSDVVVVPRGNPDRTLDRDLIDTLLFKSGRPVVVVPPNWQPSLRFEKIMVAWDGGAKAARAVGDAMPVLTEAAEVEVLCVTPDAEKSVAGADLASHLARHCKKVTLTELPKAHGDVAKTIRAHAEMARADLLVMGAYAHPRLLEMVMGGVTQHLLAEGDVPMLLAY
jgi:nucleotide-binding universal stress UspA family protein